jgi:hypothetical protein
MDILVDHEGHYAAIYMTCYCQQLRIDFINSIAYRLRRSFLSSPFFVNKNQSKVFSDEEKVGGGAIAHKQESF